jgi:hypothetical protein
VLEVCIFIIRMIKTVDKIDKSIDEVLAIDSSTLEAKKCASLAMAAASLEFCLKTLEGEDVSQVREVIQIEIKPVLKEAAAAKA